MTEEKGRRRKEKENDREGRSRRGRKGRRKGRRYASGLKSPKPNLLATSLWPNGSCWNTTAELKVKVTVGNRSCNKTMLPFTNGWQYSA